MKPLAQALSWFLASGALVLSAASGQQRGRGGAPVPAQASAPIDLTGYWVSVVTEDWRWRMATPPKGDYQSLPLSLEARKVADAWDLAKDEAAGLQMQALRRRQHHAAAGTAARHLGG
jgi:hypothetical protein